jgi:hypothetical protein
MCCSTTVAKHEPTPPKHPCEMNLELRSFSLFRHLCKTSHCSLSKSNGNTGSSCENGRSRVGPQKHLSLSFEDINHILITGYKSVRVKKTICKCNTEFLQKRNLCVRHVYPCPPISAFAAILFTCCPNLRFIRINWTTMVRRQPEPVEESIYELIPPTPDPVEKKKRFDSTALRTKAFTVTSKPGCTFIVFRLNIFLS